MSPTDTEIKNARKRILRWGAVLGVVLGLICHHLPPDYRTICSTISSIAASCAG